MKRKEETGNGEVSWYEVYDIIAGVQEIEMARQCVPVLMNDEGHSAMLDFGYASSRALCVNSKFSRAKICAVVVYGPTEKDVEGRERFWNNLNRVLDRLGNGYILCVVGNLNGCVGDRLRTGIIGGLGIQTENDTGSTVVDFCAEYIHRAQVFAYVHQDG